MDDSLGRSFQGSYVKCYAFVSFFDSLFFAQSRWGWAGVGCNQGCVAKEKHKKGKFLIRLLLSWGCETFLDFLRLTDVLKGPGSKHALFLLFNILVLVCHQRSTDACQRNCCCHVVATCSLEQWWSQGRLEADSNHNLHQIIKKYTCSTLD